MNLMAIMLIITLGNMPNVTTIPFESMIACKTAQADILKDKDLQTAAHVFCVDQTNQATQQKQHFQ